jgi:hypothetical protein
MRYDERITWVARRLDTFCPVEHLINTPDITNLLMSIDQIELITRTLYTTHYALYEYFLQTNILCSYKSPLTKLSQI